MITIRHMNILINKIVISDCVKNQFNTPHILLHFADVIIMGYNIKEKS